MVVSMRWATRRERTEKDVAKAAQMKEIEHKMGKNERNKGVAIIGERQSKARTS